MKGEIVMIKKTIEYTDFEGNVRKEDFYFNFMESEIFELELGVDGGLSGALQRIIDRQDSPSIISNFKEIILAAYGEKSADGRRFIKSKELKDAFSQTEAFSKLFMELSFNDVAASEFINGIVPGGKAAVNTSSTMSENNVVDITGSATISPL